MMKERTLKMRTKMPKGPGIRATREMRKAFVSEMRALEALRRVSTEACRVIFSSGEMEMETKSRPSRAALAPALVIKKLVRASGTIRCSFLSGSMFDTVDKQMSFHSGGLEGWDDRARWPSKSCADPRPACPRSSAVLPLLYLRSRILASL